LWKADRVTFTWDTKRPTVKNDVFQVTTPANFKNCVANSNTGKSLSKQLVAGTYITQPLTGGTSTSPPPWPGAVLPSRK